MDSVEQMFAAWGEGFRAWHPGVTVDIAQKDVAPEERIALGPNVEEVFHPYDGPYEDRWGYDPFRVRICQGAFVLKSHVSAIGVFVGKGNPISKIAIEQLDAIYSDARRRGHPTDIVTWGQLGLGGDLAKRPVRPLGFYWRDDVTWYFRDLVCLDAPFKAAYRVPGDDMSRRTPAVATDLMAELARDPSAIGFANFSYMTDGVKPLAVSERGVVSEPSLGEIASGHYPLQRSLYAYVNRKPGAPLDPLYREFLAFVVSRDGQNLVQKDHYLPLTGGMAQAERGKLI
jgi:phosphate transport system substrate-binding protein